jgi:hypothetical protein
MMFAAERHGRAATGVTMIFAAERRRRVVVDVPMMFAAERHGRATTGVTMIFAAERRRRVARGESEANTPGKRGRPHSCRASGTGRARTMFPVPLTRHTSFPISGNQGCSLRSNPWLPSNAAPRQNQNQGCSLRSNPWRPFSAASRQNRTDTLVCALENRA